MRRVMIMAVLALAGCAGQQETGAQRAEAALDARQSACNVQFPEARGNYLPRAKCVEGAQRGFLAAQGGPGDLTELAIATRASLAASADRGEITKEEHDLHLARAMIDLNDRLAQRRQAVPPPPSPIIQQQPARVGPALTCRTFGNTTTCD
jgi:hypothetical protein